LALIAYLHFSIGQIHFTWFAFFAILQEIGYYVMGTEVLGPVALARYRTFYNQKKYADYNR
jgi:hypothetical protein